MNTLLFNLRFFFRCVFPDAAERRLYASKFSSKGLSSREIDYSHRR